MAIRVDLFHSIGRSSSSQRRRLRAGGYDADLVLVDLDLTGTVRNEEQETRCRWSPWHGLTLAGWPVRTWVLGREVYRDGQIDESIRGGEARFDQSLGAYWATAARS